MRNMQKQHRDNERWALYQMEKGAFFICVIWMGLWKKHSLVFVLNMKPAWFTKDQSYLLLAWYRIPPPFKGVSHGLVLHLNIINQLTPKMPQVGLEYW
jgi:hypothetical protein